MDGDGGGLRGAECADGWVCALALADGVVDKGYVEIFILVNNLALMLSMAYGAVLYDHPSARDWRWGRSSEGWWDYIQLRRL